METIVLGNYFSFACLAGKCTSTCCAGWQIFVDEKDYKRFLKLEPLWLRQDILSHIRKKDGNYYFQNGEDGRCAMLDGDGLCRIQRNTEEKALCNTCRKYPRLINQTDRTLYLSMAASCPVVADFLLCGTVFWTRGGKKEEAKELPVLKEVWDIYETNQNWAKTVLQQRGNEALLYGCFEKIASSVLDIVLQYQEGSGLLSFFQVLEREVSGCIGEFTKDTDSVWEKFRGNYMVYRLLSRKMEFPEEAAEACYRQASGELFLLRTIAFCAYADGQELTREKWTELICMVYRFCVHGKKVSGAFGKMITSFFPEDCFWSYLLF